MRALVRMLVRLLPLVLLSACSSADRPAAAPDDGTGGQFGGTGGALVIGNQGTGGSPQSLGGSDVSFDGSRIEAQILVRSVLPGAEQHVCVVVELPNSDHVWIDRIDATLSGGSHHLIVDRQATDSPVQLEPQPCMPTTASDATRLVIAQQPTTHVALPSGAAFSIDAHQHLFMQLHYFNAGTVVRDITGTVDLVLADASAPTPTKAMSLFTGTMSINLPPHQAGQAQAFFKPVPDYGKRHVFALTSHTHHLGVDSTIERVAGLDAPPTTPIHESLNWDEPPLTSFDPPLDFDGSDGLRLICNYQNTTSQTVNFGTAVDNEMCFMWVYYFDR
jgi:Copper type II ascorbate-dependent monooxygenase, C-terminal domain